MVTWIVDRKSQQPVLSSQSSWFIVPGMKHSIGEFDIVYFVVVSMSRCQLVRIKVQMDNNLSKAPRMFIIGNKT